MILYLLDLRVPMSDQKDFDDALEARMPDLLGLFGVESGPELEAAFQRYRAGFRERDDSGWMGRNPLYPGMIQALSERQGDLRDVFVTTSKPSTVSKGILEHNGFTLPVGHVLGKDMVGASPDKNVHMRLVTEAANVAYADIHFVDDQVAHLESAQGLGVNCYLAAYGYTTEKQIDRARALGIRCWKKGTYRSGWVGYCRSPENSASRHFRCLFLWHRDHPHPSPLPSRERGLDTPPIPLLRPFDSAHATAHLRQGERNAPPWGWMCHIT